MKRPEKPGDMCFIIGGHPDNLGLPVTVVEFMGDNPVIGPDMVYAGKRVWKLDRSIKHLCYTLFGGVKIESWPSIPYAPERFLQKIDGDESLRHDVTHETKALVYEKTGRE